MWIFNEVVTKPEKGLCCRSWGIKLRARLARIEAWAEKQVIIETHTNVSTVVHM